MPFGYSFHDLASNAVNTTATVTVVPAPGARRRNYLLGYTLVANGGVTVQFVEVGGVALTGPMALAANVPLVVPAGFAGPAAAVNTAINMTLNTSVQVSGHVTYLSWF